MSLYLDGSAALTKFGLPDHRTVIGADNPFPLTPGTARKFGLLDSAFAVCGAALVTKQQPLIDYSKLLAGEVLQQTVPVMTASTIAAKLDILAKEIHKAILKTDPKASNPLDVVYDGPVFPQSENDLFSGRLADAPSHWMEEKAPAIGKKFAEIGQGLSTLVKVGIGIGVVAGVALLASVIVPVVQNARRSM